MELLPDDLLEALERADYPRWWLELPVGAKLRTLRQALGVSREQAARAAGVPQSTVSRLEGGCDARLGTWLRLFGALGFDFVVARSVGYEDVQEMLEEERKRLADRQFFSQFQR